MGKCKTSSFSHISKFYDILKTCSKENFLKMKKSVVVKKDKPTSSSPTLEFQYIAITIISFKKNINQ